MAGDWIKMEAATPDKPEVLAIAARMGWDDPDLAVGKLFRVWRWFDQHTTEGNAPGVTPALLDRIAGVSGFAEAMSFAGWLLISDDGLTLPNFSKHCGKTAKERAQTARRVAVHKDLQKANAEVTQAPLPTALPREEKRRSKQPLTPSPAGFGEFWSAYPRRRNRGDAEKAWRALKPDDSLQARILEAVEVAKTRDDWRKDGGQFIPYPASWLRAKGWEDEPEVAPRTAGNVCELMRGAV